MKKYFKTISFIFILTLINTNNIHAQTAQQILQKADKLMQPFDDKVYNSKITLYEGANAIKTYEISIICKGSNKQLITFKAPGEVRGMKVLMLDAETMYVYLPQFKRVRRIASHVRNTTFLGSDFSYADMSETQFGNRWRSKIVEATKGYWKIELMPGPNNSSSYTKIVVTIDKRYNQPTLFEYYEGTVKVKSQIREDWQKIKGVDTPNKVIMVNHQKNTKTVNEFTKCEINTGVSDSIFSEKSLSRGN